MVSNNTLNETTPGLSTKNVNPQAEELASKINELNKQYVNNPTPSNKRALSLAQMAYKNALKAGGTAASAYAVSKNKLK